MRLVIASGICLENFSFSVYFYCILNEKNGSFHIEIMISAAHMLGQCYHEKKI